MIRKLTKILQKERQRYNFKQSNGFAGICPDCGNVVTFNSYHQRYQCSQSECCFEANVKMERVWDNKMREENLKKLKNKNQGLSI
ncbi:MAG: hypothetical protein IJW36_00700 [Clostridia bacterium]|nr:hypothetical protein [Clostridia bacterium]